MEMNSVLIDIAENVVSSMVMVLLEWLFKRFVAPVLSYLWEIMKRKFLQVKSQEDASGGQ